MSVECVVATPPELAAIFVERVGMSMRELHDNRALSLVLPGGSVSQAFLPILAASDLDWTRIEVFWGDERAVAPDDRESNYRLAETLLLSRVQIDPARVHRMPADEGDLDRAARKYEAEIVRVLGDPPRFNIVLLGVGPDGHVCSLFPDHPALDITSRRVVAVTDSPKPPPSRLTLTLPALVDAHVFVAAFGASKTAVIREALLEPDSVLPVARAARVGRTATFLLDPDAARV